MREQKTPGVVVPHGPGFGVMVIFLVQEFLQGGKPKPARQESLTDYLVEANFVRK